MPIRLPLSMFAPSFVAVPRRVASLRGLLLIALAVVIVHALFLRHARLTTPGPEGRARPAAALQVRALTPPTQAAPPAVEPKLAAQPPRPARAIEPKPTRERAAAALVTPTLPDTRGREAASVMLDVSRSVDPPPTYPTTMPAPFRQLYEVRRGAQVGVAELHWRPAGDAYEARLTADLGEARWLEWTSRGGFDEAGVAPLRFTDQRRGRAALAANFQRGEAATIVYSGPEVRHVLYAGAQDRLSWIVQLSAIAQGRGSALAGGESISMVVSGARGDADVWVFSVTGPELIECAGDRVSAIKLVREPRRPYDTQAEIWLDPAREHLPARLRLSNVPGGDPLEFVLRETSMPGP